MVNNPQLRPRQPPRPPIIRPPVPSQDGVISISRQFRPVLRQQPMQPYTPAGSQLFQSDGHVGVGRPLAPPQTQFVQPQQVPPRPTAAGHSLPQAQAHLMPDYQPKRPVAPVPLPPLQNMQIVYDYMPSYGGPRMPPASYNLSPSSVGQPPVDADSSNQYQQFPQSSISSLSAGQPWTFMGNRSANPVTPVQQIAIAPMQQTGVTPMQQTVFTPAQQTVVAPAQQSAFPPEQQPAVAPGQKNAFILVQQSDIAPGQQSAFPPVQWPAVAPGLQSAFTPGQQTTITPVQQTAVTPGQQTAITPVQHNADLPAQETADQCRASSNPETNKQPDSVAKAPSIWLVHTSRGGKTYYYNRRTQQSTWQKPLELMTEVERADATTDWEELISPDGMKYYYNKVTKQSKWAMPDELKLARERIKVDPMMFTQATNEVQSCAATAVSVRGGKSSPSINDGTTFSVETMPSAIPLAPVVSTPSMVAFESLSSVVESFVATTERKQTSIGAAIPTHAPIEASPDGTSDSNFNSLTPPRNNSDVKSPEDTAISVDGVSPQNMDSEKEGTEVSEKDSIPVSGEKRVELEKVVPLVYETKQEAKISFKELLETANVGSDWNWNQAMRVIINDKRYGALKSLSERKKAFNEYVGEKKRQEAAEKRARQKKAREDFNSMLQESRELTLSTKWSKAIFIFGDDARFTAVERAKERQNLFEHYMEQLGRKERAKALEEWERNRLEYLEFLKSCDFIKARSQWRKVQDRLEGDERCSRLEKLDRFEVFQEYIRDLEKEEEEQRKLKMEALRKIERKNRDDFRKLMGEHVRAGILTAKTHWRDYCMKIKDSPAYIAVSLNTSGSTAKDLFEDVVEELEKQFLEDKEQIKDAIKMAKVTLSSSWTLEDLKSAISEDLSSPPLISTVNFKLVFDELLERAREKEEKEEAKRRKRLEDDFYEFLHSSNEITFASRWDDIKHFVEERFGEDNRFQEIFEIFTAELKEKKAKKRERKREHKEEKEKARKYKDRKERQKKKYMQRREKASESRKYKDETTDSDRTESPCREENKRSGRDKGMKRKERKRYYLDDSSSQRHSAGRKRSKHQMEKYASTHEAESGSHHKSYSRRS